MRVHRTKAIVENDGCLSLALTGLPFTRGERVEVVLMEEIAAFPLSYRSAAPPAVNHTPEGEWILFVIGAIISVLFCVYLGLAP